MIAHRIRRAVRKDRPAPRKLASSIIALCAYALDADPTLLIRAQGFENLTGYALDLKLRELGVQSGEKVLAYGARNLRGFDTKSWEAQMVATALRCPRSKDPLDHIVVSWRPGEAPDRRQMKEAVDLIATTLGAGRNQIIWAAHSNTENIHIHIIINRIDPMSHRATQLGDGWDRDRLMQAVALIECRQGWQRETLAPYVANDLGEVRKITDGTKVRNADGTQLIRKGDRAAELADWRRRADIAALAGAMLHAADWPTLHAEFARRNAKLIAKGSGAIVILADGHEHRASRFGTGCKFSALEARLGTYRPAAADQRSHDEFKAHQSQIAALHRRISDERAATLLTLKLAEHAHRARIHRSNASLARRNAVEAAMANEFAAAKAAMRAAYDDCFAAIGAARVTPSNWAKGRRSSIPVVSLPKVVVPLPGEELECSPAKGYAVQHTTSATTYARGGKAAFVDYRVCIVVLSQRDDDVLAVLRMAEARWGEKTVIFGDPQFHAQCARLAAEHGLAIYPPAETPPAVARALQPAMPERSRLRAETPSTFPLVFTTPATLKAMKELVSARGHSVGMTGEVRYDRTAKAFRIDGSVPDHVRRELETVLAPYMTEDARRYARSLQYEHPSLEISVEDGQTQVDHVRQDPPAAAMHAWPSLTDADDPSRTWHGWDRDAGPAATMFTKTFASSNAEQNKTPQADAAPRSANDLDRTLSAAGVAAPAPRSGASGVAANATLASVGVEPVAPRARAALPRSPEDLELAREFRDALAPSSAPRHVAPRSTNALHVDAEDSRIAVPKLQGGSGSNAVATGIDPGARSSSPGEAPSIVATRTTVIAKTDADQASPSDPPKASEFPVPAQASAESKPVTVSRPATVSRDADADEQKRQRLLQAQASARSAGR